MPLLLLKRPHQVNTDPFHGGINLHCTHGSSRGFLGACFSRTAEAGAAEGNIVFYIIPKVPGFEASKSPLDAKVVPNQATVHLLHQWVMISLRQQDL